MNVAKKNAATRDGKSNYSHQDALDNSQLPNCDGGDNHMARAKGEAPDTLGLPSLRRGRGDDGQRGSL